MYKEKLQRINDFELLLPKSAREGMNVDAKIIANEAIINAIEDDAIKQLTNVAMMPGVVDPVVAMSDCHWGYGLPVGSVAAFDAEKGMISAGLCGFDINCGIHVLKTNLTADEIRERSQELCNELFKAVPCGVGGKGKLRISNEQLDEVFVNGVDWAIENEFGTEKDKKRIEENGRMEGADPKKVSDLARKRGHAQLGTLGAGNHFIEIQRVDRVYDEKAAKKWGIGEVDQGLVMIHCGSRGLGHQIATDYLKVQEAAVKKYKITLADRQLACAPIASEEGQDYFKAMICAVNYSFTNKLVMTQWIRETFAKVFKRDWESMGLETVYGIAHNVVKKERYTIEGEKRDVFVHRKGATRSFPGDPVLIAGSMGTASHIMKGTEIALSKSFGSSAHGAGRAMSRTQALRDFDGRKLEKELNSRGIATRASTPKSLAEEAPKAYKDVDEVIESIHGAGSSSKVIRMPPLGVVKG